MLEPKWTCAFDCFKVTWPVMVATSVPEPEGLVWVIVNVNVSLVVLLTEPVP